MPGKKMESFYEQQAFELVNNAIESALKAVVLEKRHNLANIVINYNDGDEIPTPNIKWSPCQDFTSDVGLKQIEEFISTWKRDSAWLYCIDFLGPVEEHDYDNRYKYRVRWSIPTRRKPIPRATACVYFTVHVSKIKPKVLPVEVYYVFEGNRLVHRPGKSKFREIWLKDIIQSKIITMEEVTF